MSYNRFYEYDTVADRVAKAKKQLDKIKKKNPDICPIIIEGNKITKSWWGNAWTKNLEIYADYSNRIGRGRSYVKNGLVLDLKITEGLVESIVCGSGSKPYTVTINIKPLSQAKIKNLTKTCNNKINNLEELVEGRFPKELESLFTQTDIGLFPSKKEISFDCSCPDGAYMCKHVSAALYAIGAKFDSDPALFFVLRGVDFNLFLAKTVEEKMNSMLRNAGKASNRILDDKDISGLFGIL